MNDPVGLTLLWIVGGALGLAIYFAPTVVAVCREHENGVGIALVNLFLGWSLVGWVVALVWSTMGEYKTAVVVPPSAPRGRKRLEQLGQQWPEDWGDPPEPEAAPQSRYPDDIPDEWLNG